MIVDLHAHYAMHLMDEYQLNPARALRSARSAPRHPGGPHPATSPILARYYDETDQYRRPRRVRVVFLWLFRWINVAFNYRSLTSGPGVTLELMKKGGVGVVLSPLLDPLNEFGGLPTWLLAVAFSFAGFVLALLASLGVALIGHWVGLVVVLLALAVLVFVYNRLVIALLLASLGVALDGHWKIAFLGHCMLWSPVGLVVVLLALVALHKWLDAVLPALLASLVVVLIGLVALVRLWVEAGIAHLGSCMLESTVGMSVVPLIVLAVLALHNRLDWGWDELPGSPPRGSYPLDLWRQRCVVERDVQAVGDWACVAHDITELNAAIDAEKIAIVHCVEGGFQLGASAREIERNVATLAQSGVAYVTLAHLLWRQVATNAPAIPFLSDGMYRCLFHQPHQGLGDLGKAAVCAMFRNGVLIDVTHMSQVAIDETFALLRCLEGKGEPVPVIATHMACRFGKHEYNLRDDTITEIGRRKGVMGVIFCEHWMRDGPWADDPRSEERTFEIICKHIDRIFRLTDGSHEFAAIGSDLDGFIKPMLRGLENMGRMRHLETRLNQTYREDARLILCDNALRVLRSAWRAPRY